MFVWPHHDVYWKSLIHIGVVLQVVFRTGSKFTPNIKVLLRWGLTTYSRLVLKMVCVPG